MKKVVDLKMTFNEDAERYNEFRPRYPDALFSELIQKTRLTKNSKLLEIGPGTGQATEPLATLGCEITGIELGADLAAIARSVLTQYPNVRIVTGSFEDTVLPNSYYDLIFSATAFHWIKDDYKFTKTASLLKPNGYLAIIHTEHISEENGDKFYYASQPIYGKFWPPKSPKLDPLPKSSELKAAPIDDQLYELKSFDIFPKTITYSAKNYAGLLSTYSPTIALPSAKRKEFLADIESLIIEHFGGKTEKRFAFTLAIAWKKHQTSK